MKNLLAALISIFVAGCVYLAANAIISNVADGRFSAKNDELVKTLQTNIDNNISALTGVQSLLQQKPDLSAAEWKNYFQILNLKKDYPGIGAIGFSQRIKNEDKATFESEVAPIKPASDKAEYLALKYIEPIAGRESALGLDVSVVTEQYPTVLESLSSGTARVSPPTRFVTTGKSGFFIALPVYNTKMPTATKDERKKAYQGVVGASYISDEFFTKIFSDSSRKIGISVYGDIKRATLLYSRENRQFNYEKTKTYNFELLNQTWQLRTTSTKKDWLSQFEETLPVLSAIVAAFAAGAYANARLRKYHL